MHSTYIRTYVLTQQQQQKQQQQSLVVVVVQRKGQKTSIILYNDVSSLCEEIAIKKERKKKRKDKRERIFFCININTAIQKLTHIEKDYIFANVFKGNVNMEVLLLEWIHLLAYDDAKFFKLEIYRLGSACNIKRVIVENLYKNRIYVTTLFYLIISKTNEEEFDFFI